MRRGNFEGVEATHLKVYGLPPVCGGDAAFRQITMTTCCTVYCTLCCAGQIGELEEQGRRQELSVETSRSRVSELTTLHDTARHDVDLLTQRNHTLNDQINDLHAQVRVAMTTNTLCAVYCPRRSVPL